MKFNAYFGIVILVLLVSCASLPEVVEGVEIAQYHKVNVGWGPEDFELDQSNAVDYPRLLVACDERREGKMQGEIWEVDLTDFQSRKLEVVFKDSTNFHPHGVSAYQDYLFVISHNDKQEEFYRFRIEGDRLYEDTVFTEGIIGHGNDIFAVGEQEFYYSDFKFFGGSVVRYFEGEWEKVIRHMKYPNGVYILGDALYVTTTLQNKVFAYDHEVETKEKIAKVKGGDNLSYDGTYLYTTSHPRFGKFIKHYKDADKISPSVVYRIGINGNEVIYSNSGEEISAASVAWRYEDYLIIGQVFDDFLWVGKIESDN
ncbi:hypothetical protein CRYO30217_01139 [Parvicella tangerina]|uniref:Lipoprotein n=2 Tax=Parvicella tangerina TaxID=2829795 RepID=A0A916NGL3_9FLAO|nr:hypothetical protein CRYO30217_01139 [Parvicella tangerina]